MHVLILGGTGFIGLEITRAFISAGHHVTVANRGNNNSILPENITTVKLDRFNHAEVMLFGEEHKSSFDLVIDTYAMTKESAEITVNALGKISENFFILSSHDVYAQFGLLHGHPCPEIESIMTENSPLTIPYPYRGIMAHDGGETYDKKDVEKVFAESSIKNMTIFRLPAVFGTGDPQYRYVEIIDHLKNTKSPLPCHNHGTWRWTHSHVKDVANAISIAASHMPKSHAIFNLGEKYTPTVHERLSAIASILDQTLEYHLTSDQLPKGFIYLKNHPTDIVVSSQKFRDQFGDFEIMQTSDIYQDIINWSTKKP